MLPQKRPTTMLPLLAAANAAAGRQAGVPQQLAKARTIDRQGRATWRAYPRFVGLLLLRRWHFSPVTAMVVEALAPSCCRYYLSRHCAVCDGLTHPTKPLCERCTAQPQLAAAVLASRWNRLERQYAQLVRLCLHCGGGGGRQLAEGGHM
jgi:hypothetical protein